MPQYQPLLDYAPKAAAQVRKDPREIVP